MADQCRQRLGGLSLVIHLRASRLIFMRVWVGRFYVCDWLSGSGAWYDIVVLNTAPEHFICEVWERCVGIMSSEVWYLVWGPLPSFSRPTSLRAIELPETKRESQVLTGQGAGCGCDVPRMFVVTAEWCSQKTNYDTASVPGVMWKPQTTVKAHFSGQLVKKERERAREMTQQIRILVLSEGPRSILSTRMPAHDHP